MRHLLKHLAGTYTIDRHLGQTSSSTDSTMACSPTAFVCRTSTIGVNQDHDIGLSGSDIRMVFNEKFVVFVGATMQKALYDSFDEAIVAAAASTSVWRFALSTRVSVTTLTSSSNASGTSISTERNGSGVAR